MIELHRRLAAHRRGSETVEPDRLSRMQREYELLRGLMTDSLHPDLTLKSDCRLLIASYRALKVINPQSTELNARVRVLNDRGCL
jgi:hypothetical protein